VVVQEDHNKAQLRQTNLEMQVDQVEVELLLIQEEQEIHQVLVLHKEIQEEMEYHFQDIIKQVEVVELPQLEAMDQVLQALETGLVVRVVQEHQTQLQEQQQLMLAVGVVDLKFQLEIVQEQVVLVVVEPLDQVLLDQVLLEQLILVVEVVVHKVLRVLLEQVVLVVRVSLLQEHLQIQELYLLQVQDVRDQYLKHQMVDKLQVLQLQELYQF
tara:strand:- start:224 stop:862 length:639 start_codon:yes stop_codon:yes gene_type:complete